MTLETISENQDFLIQLANGTARERKKLLKNCTAGQAECIVEILSNFERFRSTKKSSKFQTLLKYFSEKKTLSFKKVKAFLISNHIIPKAILAIVLKKILEEAVVCACTN